MDGIGGTEDDHTIATSEVILVCSLLVDFYNICQLFVLYNNNKIPHKTSIFCWCKKTLFLLINSHFFAQSFRHDSNMILMKTFWCHQHRIPKKKTEYILVESTQKKKNKGERTLFNNFNVNFLCTYLISIDVHKNFYRIMISNVVLLKHNMVLKFLSIIKFPLPTRKN